MAYTAGFSVNVGDPTKASDVTTLAANDDFLKAAVDAIMADSATPSSTLKATVVLADGVTATTQSAGNNTTRVATTAFVKTAVDASSTDPGGSNTQIQYNNSGAFGASANLTFDGSTLAVTGALSATGNISFDGGSFVFNESGADKDFRIEGDSQANLFVADASTDRIGIGTATPAAPLEVIVAPGNGIRITDPSASADASEAMIGLYGSTDGGTRLGWLGFGGTSNSIMSMFNDQSDSMTFGTAGTERLRIGADGNIGIKCTDPTGTGSVQAHDLVIGNTGLGSSEHTGITLMAGTGGISRLDMGDTVASAQMGIYCNHSDDTMNFVSGPSVRMTLLSSGDVLIGTSDTANAGRFKVLNSDGEYTSAFFNSNGSSPYGLFLSFSGAAPNNNTTNHYLHCNDNSGSDRLKIWSNGDVQNANGTYGTLSDIKLKQDITDMRSYWADFASLQYRKYRHKSDVAVNADAPYRIGLVAQEVESVFPSCVVDAIDQEPQDVAVLDEDGNATYEQTAKLDADGNAELDADGNTVMTNKLDDDGNAIPITETKTVDLGTVTKWVKSSIIEGPIMASVVQELQTRLEAAEAKIAALEAA